MRIGYEIKSQKSGIMYKWATQYDTDANDNMHACVTLHYADVNDDMHDCVTPHDAHSNEHIHWAPCTVLTVILISSTHLAQVWVSPFIPSTWSSTCVCSLRFDFSFYFPLFLPSLFLFLFLFLTDKKFMANLYNSAKEGVDTNDVLSFSTDQKSWLLGAGERKDQQAFVDTTRIDRNKWSRPLDSDWSQRPSGCGKEGG